MVRRIFSILLSLFVLMISSVAFANFYSVKDSGWINMRNQDTFVFEATGEPLKIKIKKDIWSNDKMFLQAHYKKEKIYDEPMRYVSSNRIEEICDKASGHILYIVSIGNDAQYIMGYDRTNKKWQTYAFNNDFYSPFGINTYSQKFSLKNGELELSCYEPSQNQHYVYRFFWDSNANWIGYTCLGMR